MFLTLYNKVPDKIVIAIDCVGFNEWSTLVVHFVSSSREMEKKDGRESRRDEREGQGRKEQE